MTGFTEYHLKAAPILQENLQVEVKGYNTLCSCKIKGVNCEIVFKGINVTGGWLCQEAVVTMQVPETQKTPQTYRRQVVAINPEDDIAQACARVSEVIERVGGVKKILLKKRSEWQALIENDPLSLGVGKTHLEALGDLVMKNPGQFGLEIAVV
jgi:hypothetical protein